ncbi:MAG: selenium cofactor biosynthesis protein YqeC [Clostridiales bacterium]|nr:selenium cofactor biosynthesis protein YqeC [Clostridiales bacterium]
MISLTGGGGKTTLIYWLAEYYAKQGYRTLISTTTHMQQPRKDVWVRDWKDLEEHWKQEGIAVMGEACENGKIRQPEYTVLERGIEMADVVLLEADGAKGLPCKVPSSREPVILPQSDLVIGVMGLSALGKTLEETCFRLEETMAFLGKEKDQRLTEEDAARILSSEKGTRKSVGNRAYYVVLNQCDDPERFRMGMGILRRLEDRGIAGGVMTCLKDEAEW